MVCVEYFVNNDDLNVSDILGRLMDHFIPPKVIIFFGD